MSVRTGLSVLDIWDRLSNHAFMIGNPSRQAECEAEALRLGATKEAVRKWRVRGIPAAWKLRLIQTGRFKAADFPKQAEPPQAAE